MKKLIKKYLKEFLLFATIIVVATNAMSLYRSMDLNKSSLPNFLHVEPNKPVMVHFWATWCPVCKTEIDNIQRLSKDYQVITVIVNSGSDEDIQKYMKERGLDFRVINDYDSQIAHEFGVKIYPTTMIYDKDKKLVFSDVGYTSTIALYLRMMWAS
jgi:thiol-disulfide isomerase/thioredoxin